MKHRHLENAKKAKNDEFYTQLPDIEKELQYYAEHFKDKTIYCNCDNPSQSNFWRYFHERFTDLGLKKLIASFWDCGRPVYSKIYEGGNDNNLLAGKDFTLKGDGDFRSQECIELLKETDIVVTNPPFSLFREYIAQLLEYDKKFIIISQIGIFTNKTIFSLLRNNKIQLGLSIHSGDIAFYVPDDYPLKAIGCGIEESNNRKFIRVKGIRWFTNLKIKQQPKDFLLSKHYTPEEYPKYNNYDAINVNKTKDIPCDYDGIMGVPITFLDKYNPEQFEIIGLSNSSNNELAGIPNLRYYNDFLEMRQDMSYTGSKGSKINGSPVLSGKPIKGNFYYNPTTKEYVYSLYTRIFIRRKQ